MSKSSKTSLTGFREKNSKKMPPQSAMVTALDCITVVEGHRHNLRTLAVLLETYVEKEQEPEPETLGHTGQMLLEELEKIDTWLVRLADLHNCPQE